GLGYPGQPHILPRFMAIRNPAELETARRLAMTWQNDVLAAEMVIGLTAVGVLAVLVQGADAEKTYILLEASFFPAVISGICLYDNIAAIMSTASAQLLVASSAFAEDFYKGLARRDASQKELLWVGRLAVLGISLLALWMARNPDSKVLDLVAWAWAGFGATF